MATRSSETMSPKVSALVTTYNYGRFLSAAVESVLGQDYEGEVECIVVDDGSTDDTPQVAARYGERIRYIRQTNAGQAAALNRAFEESSGEILCFLDADDVWQSNKVSETVKAFQANASVGLVQHRLELVSADGAPLGSLLSKQRLAHGDVSREMRRKVLRWLFSPTSGLALRRTVAASVFPLRTVLKTQADELLAPVAALLAPVCGLEEALGQYLIHGENLWATEARERQDRSVSGPAEARRLATLLEEKVAQANEALARAGLPRPLSPWLKWSYLKYRAEAEGRRPADFLKPVWKAVGSVRGLPLWERLALGLELTRRALKAGR